MSPEQRNPSIQQHSAEHEKGEASPTYAELADRLIADAPHFNDKQLEVMVNDHLLSKVIDAANAGAFILPEDDERRMHSENYDGSPLQVISLLQLSLMSKVMGNPDWQSRLPGDESLQLAVGNIMKRRRLSQAYGHALRVRREEIIEQMRRGQEIIGTVSPEVERTVETREDLAETAFEAPDISLDEPVEQGAQMIDSSDVPLTRRASFKERVVEEPVSPWAPPSEQPKKFEHVDPNSLMIGDKIMVPFVVHDPDTDEVIPNNFRYEAYEVKGTITAPDGKTSAVLESEAGLDFHIPLEVLESDKDAQNAVRRYLGGIDIDKLPSQALADKKDASPLKVEEKPSAHAAALTAESLKEMMGVPKHVAIESKVFVTGGGEALRKGEFLGFYNEGDPGVSAQPKKYAAIRLDSNEVVGVHAHEVTHDAQQMVKRKLFKAPARPQTTPSNR